MLLSCWSDSNITIPSLPMSKDCTSVGILQCLLTFHACLSTSFNVMFQPNI